MKQDNNNLGKLNETEKFGVSLKWPYIVAEDIQQRSIVLFEGSKQAFSTTDRQHLKIEK